MAGHHASLLHNFSRNTCLFIGLSLQDGTLRHLLRQSAIINPGHFHYLVQWRPAGATRDRATERTIRDSNFQVYNLITLFMDDAEISALGKLISMGEGTLRREAEEIGIDLKYCYYITGAVGTGKTTSVSYLASFKTHDEWAETRLPELGKSWTDLTEEEKDRVDTWIIRQFNLKNCKLLDNRIGIHVVDRSPLDPLAFTDKLSTSKKAAAIVAGLRPGKSNRSIQSGQIVFLKGQPDDLEARVVGRHKLSTSVVISEMQNKLDLIFSAQEVTIIDTFGRSVGDVVKRVAYEILRGEYQPIELGHLLEQLSNKGLDS